MRTTQFIQLMLLLLFACNGASVHKKIGGYYYVKAIDLRLFELPDTTLSKVETYFKTTPKDSMTNDEKKEYDYLQFLLEHNFLNRPYIRLILDNGDKTMLFLDKIEYDKIIDLTESDTKIRIEAEVDELKIDNISLYNARKLTTVEKTSGQTHYEK